jgi:hypothetical protein
MIFSRQQGLSVDEIQGILEEEEQENRACDVLLLPSEEDDVSDEDSDDEEGVLPKDPNHLGKGILSQLAELQVYDEEDELPDLTVVNTAGDVVNIIPDETAAQQQAGPSQSTRGKKRQRRDEEEEEEEEEDEMDEMDEMHDEDKLPTGLPRKLARLHNRDRVCKKSKPSIFGMSVPDFQTQPMKTLPTECETPYDFYKLFMDDDFVEKLVKASRLYCIRKNRAEVLPKLTSNNFRVSQAIMYLTGYLTPSNRRMFWEKREDTENMFVRKAMSKNTFNIIIANSYFVERVDPDPGDRFWKVRPLFDQLNQSAKQWVRHPERVAIDEGMIKYYGPHPLKQFMRGKPHRFGYKVIFWFYLQTVVDEHCTILIG